MKLEKLRFLSSELQAEFGADAIATEIYYEFKNL